MYLSKIKGNHYICRRVKKGGMWTQEYLVRLGKIPKADADESLAQFERELATEPIYRTIVLDPPWPMKKSLRTVRPNQTNMDYKMMTLNEIKRFPLHKFISPDGCHVYLWTTQSHLRDAFDVFKAWGVDHHCTLTWIKDVGFTPFSFMFSTEFVLFGMIGNLALIRKGVRTDFKGKVREHSRKPDEFYEIVKRVSPDPRIDIFSREKRDGFDQFGYQTDCFNLKAV